MCNLSDRIEEKGIEKGFAKGIEEGIEKGIEKGIEQGLKEFVKMLGNYIHDEEKLYQAVIETETYKDTPKELVLKHLREKA